MINAVFEKERKEFDALKKWIYLDHATFGLIPHYALEVMQDYLFYRNEEGIRVERFWDMWRHADDLRNLIGSMIGCSGSEIVHGQSSTQLMNIFANGINIHEGENVVTTDSVYPADAYVWLNKGVEVRFASTGVRGITPEELMSYADARTRAIVLCMTENRTGWLHDVKTIGRMCHEKGILLCVDATQCTNVVEINVKDMNIDFLTSSVYKWLMGCQGYGFGYISRDLLPKLAQSTCGWVGSVDRSHNSAMELKLSADAKKFELGGISFVALCGMEKVISRYLELGPEKVERRVKDLVQYLYDRAVKELERFRVDAQLPEKNRSGIVIFRIPQGLTITDDMLEERGIRARVMHGTTIRTGFHYINNARDVDCLVDALYDIEKKA